MERRKANRAAACRVSPRNNPAEMVAPERETPGISASAWARPTITPSFGRDALERSALAAQAIGEQEHDTERDQRRPDQVEVARALLDLIRERGPEDHDRDGREDQIPPHARVEVLPALGVAQAGDPGDGDAGEIPAEVDEDGGQRPELYHGREGRAWVRPADERGHDA